MRFNLATLSVLAACAIGTFANPIDIENGLTARGLFGVEKREPVGCGCPRDVIGADGLVKRQCPNVCGGKKKKKQQKKVQNNKREAEAQVEEETDVTAAADEEAVEKREAEAEAGMVEDVEKREAEPVGCGCARRDIQGPDGIVRRQCPNVCGGKKKKKQQKKVQNNKREAEPEAEAEIVEEVEKREAEPVGCGCAKRDVVGADGVVKRQCPAVCGGKKKKKQQKKVQNN